MPVIKSVFKNVRVSARKHLVNLKTKENFRSKVKEFNRLFTEKKMEEVKALVPALYKALDLAAKKHVISFNSASRKKSSIAKKVSDKNFDQVAVKAVAPKAKAKAKPKSKPKAKK